MSFDEKSRQAGRLLFVLDMLLTVLVFLVSYRMREFFFSHNPADYFSHLALLPLVLALQGALLAYSGIYRGLRISSVFSFVWSILRVLLISIVTLSTIIFLLKAQYVSRSFLVIFYILDLVVLVFVRLSLIWWYFLRSREKHENYLKVLIIGTGNRAKHLSHMLQKHAEWGIDVIGYLDIKSRREDPKNPSLPVIGTVDCIGRILKERVVDEVIVAMPRSVIKDV
ncbi:MAG: sugar transferase, partial [Gammaproteobacteria bacterium]|nr:sugar transferase [Gammaproteobacteria bacterium]